MRLHPAVATAVVLVGGGMILLPLHELCQAVAERSLLQATGRSAEPAFGRGYPSLPLLLLTALSGVCGSALILIAVTLAMEPSRHTSPTQPPAGDRAA